MKMFIQAEQCTRQSQHERYSSLTHLFDLVVDSEAERVLDAKEQD